MSAKQATQEVLAGPKNGVTITFPEDFYIPYPFNENDLITWQSDNPFRLTLGKGSNCFKPPLPLDGTQPPYRIQATATANGSMTCSPAQPSAGGNHTSKKLQAGNVIIVDTSTPGPPSGRGNQN